MTMKEQENKTAWQQEPDSRGLAEMAEEVKRSYERRRAEEQAPPVDVEAEWQRFGRQHPAVRRSWFEVHRWAVAASMLLLCSLGLALGWHQLRTAPSPALAEAEVPAAVPTVDAVSEDSTRWTFRNASLRTVLQVIAERHEAQVRYRCGEEIYLYVELEKAWTLQQCVDFLNHFDRVNLKLTSDFVIVAE